MQSINIPADRGYTSEHIWLKADGDSYILGISDFAQNQLGEISFVDLPSAGCTFAAGKEFGSIESLKAVNALFMPVSGSVLEVNEALAETPTLINISPYEKGWLLRITINEAAEINTLLSARQYLSQLK
ncbi:glycine cleavage system protein GcvH [Desulfovibrio desulfuricans]|uniref:Glycine cleavage system H protein n=1 Tax=Desulfovibrio desulfuricans TaxID=876 RepID=A0A4V1CXD2_DESDE|nr:glycine cleavage system protein GcvH [Desulfovibrio desulfuricans]QCC85810.1 glycine cleavage system protein GcvH [Desulfovibrio desulfuricans]